MKDTQKPKFIYESAVAIENLLKPLIIAASGVNTSVMSVNQMAEKIRSKTAFIKENSGMDIGPESDLMERAMQFVSAKGIDIGLVGELKEFLTHCQDGTGNDLYTDEKVSQLGRASMMLALEVVGFLFDNHDECEPPKKYATGLCWNGEGRPFVGQIVSVRDPSVVNLWVDGVVSGFDGYNFKIQGMDSRLSWPLHALRAAGYGAKDDGIV